MILEKIRQSDWWIKASNYKDRHYDETSGVMLSDHLDSVLNSIDKIFDKKENLFNCQLLLLLDVFSINREMVKRDLQIVALLHDIGKPEDDKSVKVEHPLKKEMVSKRHPVVGVQAAMNILSSDDSLNEADKNKVYTLIDEHDTPYGLYRQFEKTAVVPELKVGKNLTTRLMTETELDCCTC